MRELTIETRSNSVLEKICIRDRIFLGAYVIQREKEIYPIKTTISLINYLCFIDNKVNKLDFN